MRIKSLANVSEHCNWLRCNGSELSRHDYRRLFQVIGITYGVVDNFTTFNLLDFRSRFPLGLDEYQNRTTLSTRLGDTGGQAKHRISIEQLQSHNHDQGSFILQANESHIHDINNPDLTYTTINLQGTDNRNLHLILNNHSNLSNNGTTQPIEIKLNNRRFSMTKIDDHTHLLNGTSGSTMSSFIICSIKTLKS